MKKQLVSILAIGNELLNGRVLDTNSKLLSQELSGLGLEVLEVCLLRDKQKEIASALRRMAREADLLITTGGLGPTSDDLTRYVIAEVTGRPLERSESALKKMQELYARRNRKLNPINLRQVEFPQGALILENSLGTADAFITEWKDEAAGNAPIISLPGVPAELKILLSEQVKPWLKEKFLPADLSFSETFHFLTFGKSEAALGAIIESLKLEEKLNVAYRPRFPEVILSFNTLKSTEDTASLKQQIRSAIGQQFIIAEDPEQNLPAVVFSLLKERKVSLALAESCTGGAIANLLCGFPGASKVLHSSVVAYANQAKEIFLGVQPETLNNFGAVSGETVKEMAEGVRRKTGVSLGVSISGIAGPEGASAEKPLGTFFVGIADEKETLAFRYLFPHERNMFRTYAANLALDLIRRHLLRLEMQWERE